jgi:hypothetical protein
MQTSSLHSFKFQPEKIQTGMVYHYLKSNIDGSWPARIFIRVEDVENLDVWKFEAHQADAAHVRAHMDWHIFCADRIESWIVTADEKSRPQASVSLSKEDMCFHIHWRGIVDTISIGYLPAHIYNFDLISLNVSLRHWTKPEGEMTLGILQPDFDPNPDALLRYDGTVLLDYISDEKRQNQPCRKYTIGGPGLQGNTGTLWVNRSLGHIEDLEIPIADNPAWTGFKFRLVSYESMDEPSWSHFLNQEIRQLKSVE